MFKCSCSNVHVQMFMFVFMYMFKSKFNIISTVHAPRLQGMYACMPFTPRRTGSGSSLSDNAGLIHWIRILFDLHWGLETQRHHLELYRMLLQFSSPMYPTLGSRQHFSAAEGLWKQWSGGPIKTGTKNSRQESQKRFEMGLSKMSSDLYGNRIA